MNEIWIFDRDCGGYGGLDSDRFVHAEAKILGCTEYLEDYYRKRKTYFKNRKDAEDYALPIAKLAWETFLQDMKDNNDEDEEDCTLQWESRGFHMVQQDKLKVSDLFYEMYKSNNERTSFICPGEHEYDRIGYLFGYISKEIVY